MNGFKKFNFKRPSKIALIWVNVIFKTDILDNSGIYKKLLKKLKYFEQVLDILVNNFKFLVTKWVIWIFYSINDRFHIC